MMFNTQIDHDNNSINLKCLVFSLTRDIKKKSDKIYYLQLRKMLWNMKNYYLECCFIKLMLHQQLLCLLYKCVTEMSSNSENVTCYKKNIRHSNKKKWF